MDNSTLVRFRKGIGKLNSYAEYAVRVQRSIAKHICEGPAFDVFHRNKIGALFGANFIDDSNARMAQNGCGPGFTHETFLQLNVGCNFRTNNFQSRRTSQLRIFGQIHFAHATDPEPPRSEEHTSEL